MDLAERIGHNSTANFARFADEHSDISNAKQLTLNQVIWLQNPFACTLYHSWALLSRPYKPSHPSFRYLLIQPPFSLSHIFLSSDKHACAFNLHNFPHEISPLVRCPPCLKASHGWGFCWVSFDVEIQSPLNSIVFHCYQQDPFDAIQYHVSHLHSPLCLLPHIIYLPVVFIYASLTRQKGM